MFTNRYWAISNDTNHYQLHWDKSSKQLFYQTVARNPWRVSWSFYMNKLSLTPKAMQKYKLRMFLCSNIDKHSVINSSICIGWRLFQSICMCPLFTWAEYVLSKNEFIMHLCLRPWFFTCNEWSPCAVNMFIYWTILGRTTGKTTLHLQCE